MNTTKGIITNENFKGAIATARKFELEFSNSQLHAVVDGAQTSKVLDVFKGLPDGELSALTKAIDAMPVDEALKRNSFVGSSDSQRIAIADALENKTPLSAHERGTMLNALQGAATIKAMQAKKTPPIPGGRI